MRSGGKFKHAITQAFFRLSYKHLYVFFNKTLIFTSLVLALLNMTSRISKYLLNTNKMIITSVSINYLSIYRFFFIIIPFMHFNYTVQRSCFGQHQNKSPNVAFVTEPFSRDIHLPINWLP